MSAFDPKDKKRGDSNRDDSNRFNRADSPSPFMRDKRPRVSRPAPHTEAEEAPRRSFNPNFTKDNRRKEGPAGEGNRSARPASARPASGGAAKPWNKEGGPAKPWNKEGRGDTPSKPWNKEGGSAKPWNKEGRGDTPSKPWNKEGGSAKPWSKEGGARKPWSKGADKSVTENYPRFSPPKPAGAVRLNRYIATSGVCSRREADDLIVAGVVTINGQVAMELGTKVMPGDEVRFNGEIIRGEKKVYILMNKPKGFVTTMDDAHADKTVMEIIKNACSERVYPVGRLDKNSVGVLLFTNDGELTRQLTHPSYNKRKIYQVSLDKSVTQADLERLASGIELEDGPIFADEISYVGDSHKEVGVEIHSGRNRIVRRMFESLGYSVQKLDRVYFAGLTKKSLKRGAWRFLTPREVSMLKSGEYE